MHPNMNKIVQQNAWLIGVCGEDRICDILQYVVKYPVVPKTLVKKPIEEWYSWIATRVIPIIATAIQNSLHKSYAGTIGDSELLLATHGHVFLIGETLGITNAEPYWSIGSGSHLAMGALTTQQYDPKWKEEHHKFGKIAISIAQQHDPYTRGGITGYLSYPDGFIEKI